MLVTAKMNREFKACYSDERLIKLYGEHGCTPQEVATRRDGKWEHVSSKDRVWILSRVIEGAPRREFLARLVERALARAKNPDSRSVAVIPHLRNDTVTEQVKRDAVAASEAAGYAAGFAAETAASAATSVAAESTSLAAFKYADADHAAYAAAVVAAADADAERQQQLDDLVELLKEQP